MNNAAGIVKTKGLILITKLPYTVWFFITKRILTKKELILKDMDELTFRKEQNYYHRR